MKINKEKENSLTIERLKELLEYNPDTGIFINKTSGIRREKGSIAGHIKKDTGYVLITIDNKVYRGHRLAWFYCFEEWPTKFIDHIDLNRANNRLDNLREVTNTENKQNSNIQSNNTSGYKGVSFDKESGKFKASIRVNRVLKNLGRYKTAEEASIAYQKASIEYFGEFSNESITKC